MGDNATSTPLDQWLKREEELKREQAKDKQDLADRERRLNEGLSRAAKFSNHSPGVQRRQFERGFKNAGKPAPTKGVSAFRPGESGLAWLKAHRKPAPKTDEEDAVPLDAFLATTPSTPSAASGANPFLRGNVSAPSPTPTTPPTRGGGSSHYSDMATESKARRTGFLNPESYPGVPYNVIDNIANNLRSKTMPKSPALSRPAPSVSTQPIQPAALDRDNAEYRGVAPATVQPITPPTIQSSAATQPSRMPVASPTVKTQPKTITRKPGANATDLGPWKKSTFQGSSLAVSGPVYQGDGYKRVKGSDGGWYDPEELGKTPYPTRFRRPIDAPGPGLTGENARLFAGAQALHSTPSPKLNPWARRP
jgi:hypothetical protein